MIRGIGNLIAKVHTALSAAFFLFTHTVGDGAMNHFGNCFQWRRKHFTIRVLSLSVGKAAMNAQQYWQLRVDACSRKVNIVYISTRVSVQSYDLVPPHPLPPNHTRSWGRG
jgi:hypothetical protein